jgi:hypothetical protein
MVSADMDEELKAALEGITLLPACRWGGWWGSSCDIHHTGRGGDALSQD